MKATKITIHYDDGTVVGANGAHADEVMSWWISCEQMAMIHGCQFKGTPLKRIETITQEEGVIEGGREAKNGLIVYDGLKNYVKSRGY